MALAFVLPLYDLARFSIGHDLYSHIPLIPLISGYLIWQNWRSFQVGFGSEKRRGIAAIFFGFGLLALVFYVACSHARPLAREDSLALTTTSFLLFIYGVCFWNIGIKALGAIALPLGFLLFMIPFPIVVVNGIEYFLQYGSAWAARGFFAVAGTTVYANGLVFQLPGISIQIAPECSGIHSSLALLITSVLAGYFFLRSRVNRVILALFVIPLALIRNGFRVFVIGELCVHIGPHMIDSPIHHRGGPIFFVLSLFPFFLLLYFLIRLERRHRIPQPVEATAA